MKNIVLYADGRPLISCAPDDPDRFFKVASAGADAARDARKAGVSCPSLRVVLEEREADVSGKVLLKETFTLLNPATFAPEGEAVDSLDKLGAPQSVPASAAPLPKKGKK